jgi:chromosome segregation ATPase
MSWPLIERPGSHTSLAPARMRTPKVVWVLTASAFLCGGLLSAAGFAVGWRHEAQRGSSAESALVTATSTVHTLRAQLATARATLADERTRNADLAATRLSLAHAQAGLRAQLASARRSLAALGAAAAPLAADLDRLTSELHALSSYVSSTAPGQLDGGYVQAQLSYLTKTVNGFSAAVAALTTGSHGR